jgi:hypothetical protein
VVVIDAWNGRGFRFDPLTGEPPRESPDREPPSKPADAPTQGTPVRVVRPSPLMAAYFARINQPANAIYLDGLRDYVTRIGDERPPPDRPTAYTVSWVEAPIVAPDGASTSPASSSQVTRRRLTARP